jgi:hypothetical protein
MHSRRTRGWHLTRLELAVGIVAILFALLPTVYDPSRSGPLMEPRPFGVADLIVPAGYCGMLVGLAWMFRIYRGPRDEPPRWRYRDR